MRVKDRLAEDAVFPENHRGVIARIKVSQLILQSKQFLVQRRWHITVAGIMLLRNHQQMTLNQRRVVRRQHEMRRLFENIGDIAPLAKDAIERVRSILQVGLGGILHTCSSFLFLNDTFYYITMTWRTLLFRMAGLSPYALSVGEHFARI